MKLFEPTFPPRVYYHQHGASRALVHGGNLSPHRRPIQRSITPTPPAPQSAAGHTDRNNNQPTTCQQEAKANARLRVVQWTHAKPGSQSQDTQTRLLRASRCPCRSPTSVTRVMQAWRAESLRCHPPHQNHNHQHQHHHYHQSTTPSRRGERSSRRKCGTSSDHWGLTATPKAPDLATTCVPYSTPYVRITGSI